LSATEQFADTPGTLAVAVTEIDTVVGVAALPVAVPVTGIAPTGPAHVAVNDPVTCVALADEARHSN